MKYSKDGYKRNSKDRNNPYNIIPSGNITMKDVDFPVFGMDNLGYSKIMMPGANYIFPGSSVFEIPLAQEGVEYQGDEGSSETSKHKAIIYYDPYDKAGYFKADLDRMTPELNERYGEGNYKVVPLPGQAYTDEYAEYMSALKEHPYEKTLLDKHSNAKKAISDHISHLYEYVTSKGLTKEQFLPKGYADMSVEHQKQAMNDALDLHFDAEEKLKKEYKKKYDSEHEESWDETFRELKNQRNKAYKELSNSYRDVKTGEFQEDLEWESEAQREWARLKYNLDNLEREGRDVMSSKDAASVYFADIANLDPTGDIIVMQHGNSKVGPIMMSEGSRNLFDYTNTPGVVDTFGEVLTQYLPEDHSVTCYMGVCNKTKDGQMLSESTGATVKIPTGIWSGYQPGYGDTFDERFFGPGYKPKGEPEPYNYKVFGTGSSSLPKHQDGGEYKFPGDSVFEIPLAQMGREFAKLEKMISDYLNNPGDKATDFSVSDEVVGIDKDGKPLKANIDNLRHASAGRYTAEELQNLVKGIPYVGGILDATGVDKLAGFLGSNILGVGHEVATLIEDDRSFFEALSESGEDVFNNFVGSIVGSTDISSERKDNILKFLSYNNLLPDGYVATDKNLSSNVYFKDLDGNVKEANFKSYKDGGEEDKSPIAYSRLLKRFIPSAAVIAKNPLLTFTASMLYPKSVGKGSTLKPPSLKQQYQNYLNFTTPEERIKSELEYEVMTGRPFTFDSVPISDIKEHGGENTNFNQEEEFKLYNWSNPGIGDYNYGQYISQPNQFVRPIEKDSDITNIDYLKATNPFERDITSQRQFLIDQMKSPLMRDRYRENFKLVTGEYPSEKELNTRLNAQISNSELQPNFYLEGQYVNYLPNNYWAGMQTSYGDRRRETSPLLRPYDNSGVYGGLSPIVEGLASGQMNYRPLPLVYNDIEVPLDPAKQHIGHFIAGGYRTGLKRELAELAGIKEDELPKDPEKLRELALQYNLPIGDQYKYPNIFSGVTDSRGRSLINKNILIPHELGHSFNSGQSPFFRNTGLGENTFLYNERNRRFDDKNLSLLSNYDFSGQIYKDSDTGEPRNKYQDFIINDLFGGGISTDDFHAADMSEISSAKQETVYDMANKGLWDVRGDKPFSSSDLNNMLNAEFMPQWKAGEAEMHLKAMGYTDLLDNTKTINRNNKAIENKTQKIQQNNNKIEEYNNLSREDKFSLLRQTYGTTDEQYERLNRKRQKGKKYEEAVDLFIKNEGEKYINSLQDEINKNENQINGIQSEIEDINKKNEKIRPEVEEKLDIYFNKLVQNEEETEDSTFAKYGTELPIAQSGGLLQKGLNAYNKYLFNKSKDAFGISGRMLMDDLTLPVANSANLMLHRSLDNTYIPNLSGSDLDNYHKLITQYTINSEPFKFSSFPENQQVSFPMEPTFMNADGTPLYTFDDKFARELDNIINSNKVIFKGDQNKPLTLVREFQGFTDIPVGKNFYFTKDYYTDKNKLDSYIDALESGKTFNLGDISSWSVGANTGLNRFGSNRFIIEDFPLNQNALINKYDSPLFSKNQKGIFRERELLLPSTTQFKVKDIQFNVPRKPWHYTKDDAGKITDFTPHYGTDIILDVQNNTKNIKFKKEGGETKYKKSVFNKNKMSLSNPSRLINQMLKQGIFKSEFKMGGEQKLDNGYTVKKEFDNANNIPFISYTNEPDIEGRIYYESDNDSQVNVIDIETKLNQIRSKHERTKKIILKRRRGESLSNTEKQHLNSLGLL